MTVKIIIVTVISAGVYIATTIHASAWAGYLAGGI